MDALNSTIICSIRVAPAFGTRLGVTVALWPFLCFVQRSASFEFPALLRTFEYTSLLLAANLQNRRFVWYILLSAVQPTPLHLRATGALVP